MDSRVPGVPKDGALEAQRQSSLKLVRLALRDPGLLKRYFRGKERPDGGVGGWAASAPLRCAGLRYATAARESKWAGEKELQEGIGKSAGEVSNW